MIKKISSEIVIRDVDLLYFTCKISKSVSNILLYLPIFCLYSYPLHKSVKECKYMIRIKLNN